MASKLLKWLVWFIDQTIGQCEQQAVGNFALFGPPEGFGAHNNSVTVPIVGLEVVFWRLTYWLVLRVTYLVHAPLQ